MIRRFYIILSIRKCTCPSSQSTRTKAPGLPSTLLPQQKKKAVPPSSRTRGAVYVWHISSCVPTSGLYSVMVSTSDSDSGNLGSIPGTTFPLSLLLSQSTSGSGDAWPTLLCSFAGIWFFFWIVSDVLFLRSYGECEDLRSLGSLELEMLETNRC
jgi:hypothetical protein